MVSHQNPGCFFQHFFRVNTFFQCTLLGNFLVKIISGPIILFTIQDVTPYFPIFSLTRFTISENFLFLIQQVFFGVIFFCLFVLIFVNRTPGMRGWEKLATALEIIKKMTFRRPWEKRKNRPFFPAHLHALVRFFAIFYT